MILDLTQLQTDVGSWASYNFPNAKRWEPLLGIQEEVGELSHAFLKLHQKIRSDEENEEKMADAVGDIVIFLAHFCDKNGLSLNDCVNDAWNEVKDRDWQKFPKNGRTE